MKLWVSSETAGVSAIDDRNLSKSYIQIEEDLNFAPFSCMFLNSFLVYLFCLPGPYLDSPWVVSPNFKGFSVFLSSNLYLSAG
jgi:hypothetical protein